MHPVLKRTIAGVAVVALAAGCGKKDESAQGELPPGQRPMTEKKDALNAAEKEIQEAKRLAEAAQKHVDEQVKKTAEATAAVKAAAEEQLEQGQSKFDTLLADIKKTMDAADYKNSLAKIQDGLKLPGLTAGQQNTLEDLLKKVNEAMASDAGKKLGGKLTEGLKGLGK